jgi:hypothetical protein
VQAQPVHERILNGEAFQAVSGICQEAPHRMDYIVQQDVSCSPNEVVRDMKSPLDQQFPDAIVRVFRHFRPIRQAMRIGP